jgi:F-type H+-transporting ATPase subunit delta
VEEIAEVYSRALFEVALERDVLDQIREQLGQLADAMHDNRDLAVFFFSPYFSTDEKKQGLHSALDGAEPAFENFIEALIERHRMPAIFRIRARFDELWDEEKKLLPVLVTSAVKLDEAVVKSLGDRIGEQVGREVQLSTEIQPDIIGGIVLRVGNVILDASIRNRLNQLRKQVAQA